MTGFVLHTLPLLIALAARVTLADPPGGAQPGGGSCAPSSPVCVSKTFKATNTGVGADFTCSNITPNPCLKAQFGQVVIADSVGQNLQSTASGFVCSSGLGATTFTAGNGTAAAPSFEFSAETNSGLYRVGASDIGMSIAGSKIIDFKPGGFTVAPGGSWSIDVGTLSGGRITMSGLGATGTPFVCGNNTGDRCQITNGRGAASSAATDGPYQLIHTNGALDATDEFFGGYDNSTTMVYRYLADGTQSTAGPHFPAQTKESTFGVIPTGVATVGYGSTQWLTRQVAPHPANTRRLGYGTILTTSDTSLTVVGMSTVTNLGTATSAPATDTARNMINYATGAVSGNTAGFVGPLTQTRMSYLPAVGAVVRTDTSAITSTRIFVGFTSADLSGFASLAASNAAIYCAFRFDTGIGDANWQACSSDGTTASCLDTGVSVAAATTYKLYVDGANATRCNFSINGVVKNDKSTNVSSSSSVNLGPQIEITTLTTAARNLLVNRFSLEQN